MAMCAPVSPPVVVVFVSSMLGCSCDSVTTMTLAIVITVMAPGTHHQLPRDERLGFRRDRSGLGGSLRGHGLGPDEFRHVRPKASQRGARCPADRGRSATSGLRYRPALRLRAQVNAEKTPPCPGGKQCLTWEGKRLSTP